MPNLPAATQSMLDKAGLSSAENFIFNDGFVERLRFEIDPAWQGVQRVARLFGML